MPRYRIITTARATIEETWTVEADNPAQAYDHLRAGDGTLELESEAVLGDEENRGVERMELLSADGSTEDVREGAWWDD